MNFVSATNISGIDNDFDRPLRDGVLSIASQARRAWLLSACPSGTKAIRLSKRLTSILEQGARDRSNVWEAEKRGLGPIVILVKECREF